MYASSINCTSSYASVISCRNSVCLSVPCVLCDKTKDCTEDILIPHKRTMTLVFWHQQWLAGDAPFHLTFAFKVTHPFRNTPTSTIFAYNISDVRDSKKNSVMMNTKSTTGFPTSYRWSAFVTPKYPKGWFKRWFFGIKLSFSRLKSATKLHCVKTSSSKVAV